MISIFFQQFQLYSEKKSKNNKLDLNDLGALLYVLRTTGIISRSFVIWKSKMAPFFSRWPPFCKRSQLADLIDLGVILHVLKAAEKNLHFRWHAEKNGSVGLILLLIFLVHWCLVSIGDNYMYRHLLIGDTPINGDAPFLKWLNLS